jgi:hypothetical protein
MNDQGHSLSLSDPDRSLVLSHFLTNFLQNLASCQTAFIEKCDLFFLSCLDSNADLSFKMIKYFSKNLSAFIS